MDQVRRIMVNIQIRDIATICYARLNKDFKNYELIAQLFKAKVENLFSKELSEFKNIEPNFYDLLKWFDKFVRIYQFNEKLGVK